MIIVSMGCGLGNQMFEFAFFTKMQKVYGRSALLVDTNYAFPFAHNGIELFDIFNINPPIATYDKVKSLTKYYPLLGDKNGNAIIAKLVRKLGIKPTSLIVQNDYTKYYPSFFELDSSNSYYIYGVFANYHYFKEIEEDIKNLYIFPKIEDNLNLSYKNRIESCHSVSIHIRRGDYISENIETVSEEYYFKAMEQIEKIHTNVVYFIFTDDLQYAKNIFVDKAKYVIVQGNNGKNSYRDMQLMSMCKDNIIANSTFSFWGAFLNNNPNKLVIAPNLPFTGCECSFKCDDWMVI